MKTQLIPNTDLVVSRLAYGLGMLNEDWRGQGFMQRAIDGVRLALDMGITFFDTADIYGNGQSDMALGQFIRDAPSTRDGIVLQSKCGLRVRHGWIPTLPVGVDSIGTDLTAEHISESVEGSLRRLGTDRLDVLLLHAGSPLIQPAEVARAFDRLHSSGKVLHFGVSNHTVMQMELLQKDLDRPIVANQIWLSLLHHAAVSETSSFGAMVDYCRLKDIQIQSFSPLKGHDIFLKPEFSAGLGLSDGKSELLRDTLTQVAHRHNVDVPVVMLAWLLRHPAGIIPVLGATSEKHIRDDCGALDVMLEESEWEVLLESAMREFPVRAN